MSTIVILIVCFIILIVLICGATMTALYRQKKAADVKNDFINNMTHEFKTPISTISLACEAIEDKSMNDMDAKIAYVSIIKDENTRLQKMVENILLTAQLNKGQLRMNIELVNVRALIEKILNSLSLQVISRGGGLSGMDALEQVIYPCTQMKLTVGETTFILILLTVLGSLLLSTATMFVSCLLRNGMGTMGIIVGGYFGLFALGTSVPMHMKTLSKICCLLPPTQISPRLVYEFRLFKIAGHYFRSYQVSAVSYAAAAIILIIFGYILYKRYEIKSN